MIGLLAASATWGLFWGGWAALLPAVRDQVGAGVGQLGLALFAIPVGALPAMLGMGRVCDRYGRPALGVVLGLFGVAVVLPGMVSGVVLLAGSLLLVGATSGALEVALNAATAAEEAATGQRLFHRVHAVTPIAMILAAPLVGAAREAKLSPPSILLSIAVLIAASVLLNLAARPAPRVGRVAARPRLLLSRGLVRYGVAGAAVLFLENAVEQWSALLLHQEWGAGAFLASLGPAGYLSALALGRLAAQRYGAGLTPRRAVTLAGACGAAGMAMAAFSGHPVGALAGFALAGLGAGPALPTLLGAAGRMAEQPGVAVATVTTVSYLGFLASPAAVGQTAGLVGLPVALGLVAGTGALVAAGCVAQGWTLRNRRPAAAAPPGPQT